MKPIDIPCFYMTDEVESLDRLDLDYDLEDCEVKKVTFFIIDNVSEWYEGENRYSCIRSGGTSYICPMSRKDLVNKILQET